MQRTSTRYEGTCEFSVVATVDIAPVDESLGLSGGLTLICVVSVVVTMMLLLLMNLSSGVEASEQV